MTGKYAASALIQRTATDAHAGTAAGHTGGQRAGIVLLRIERLIGGAAIGRNGPCGGIGVGTRDV